MASRSSASQVSAVSPDDLRAVLLTPCTLGTPTASTDSKTLTDDKRRTLMDTILTGAAKHNRLQYAVTVMHPQDISAGMLQRTNYSL